MTNLTQLVPTLPPDINGLGDFALALTRQLQQAHGLQTELVVANPTWAGTAAALGQPVRQLAQRRAAALVAILPRDRPLLLHYEGYGYARRGWPHWLLQALRTWRQQSRQPLLTLFHEVYPYHAKPPWTSSFWLSPLQRRLAASLLRLSDRALTSKQSYAALLRTLGGPEAPPITALPVFSNVGEPSRNQPYEQRPRRLIVFGHPRGRRLTYERDRPALEAVGQALQIEEISDIGLPTGLTLSSIGHCPLREWGVLPAAQVSAQMQGAIAGFLSYVTPAYLAKSTIFAAYAAHGLAPLLGAQAGQPSDGLQPGRHYWLAGAGAATLTPAKAAALAQAAQAWYQTHSLAVYARTVVDCLGMIPTRI